MLKINIGYYQHVLFCLVDNYPSETEYPHFRVFKTSVSVQIFKFSMSCLNHTSQSITFFKTISSLKKNHLIKLLFLCLITNCMYKMKLLDIRTAKRGFPNDSYYSKCVEYHTRKILTCEPNI